MAGKRNPGTGAFERCVKSVSERGGAYSPRGVCAEAGRRKYGAKEFAAMARAGKKRAARARGNKAGKTYIVRRGDDTRVFSTFGQALKYINSLKRAGTFEGERIETLERNTAAKRAARRNPVDEAIAAYDEFHGRKPSGLKEFTTPHHFHTFTAEIGELVKLKIRVPRERGGGVVTLGKGARGAVVTENEKRTQLFIEGGNTGISNDDLRALFGIENPHEFEYLGEATFISYYTRKDHLGKEGGTAIYEHHFGGEPGEEKTPLPRIVYDVRNKELIFAGGGYTIPKEGIDG